MTGEGLGAAWDDMQALTGWRRDHGHFAANRARQAEHWFLAEVRAGLLARLEAPEARDRLADLGQAVARGDVAPGQAAAEMLDWLRN